MLSETDTRAAQDAPSVADTLTASKSSRKRRRGASSGPNSPSGLGVSSGSNSLFASSVSSGENIPSVPDTSATAAFSSVVPAPSLAALYVYSGGQYGAHIELSAGHWLVGSDDACDIILRDAAPRHAVIDVLDAPNAGAVVHIYPLDAGVHVAGGEDVFSSSVADAGAEAAHIAPQRGQAFFLGALCLVWGDAGVPRPALSLADVLQQEMVAATPEGATRASTNAARAAGLAVAEGADIMALQPDPDTAVDTTSESATGAAAGAVVDAAGTATSAASSVGGEVARLDGNGVGSVAVFDPHKVYGVPMVSRSSSPVARFVLLALGAVLLIALSVVLTPAEKNIEQSKVDIIASLKAMDIEDLQVRVRGKGIELRGTVPDEMSMIRVQELARSLQYPVYIEVGVQEDVLRAVRRSLGIRGFHPTVSITGQGANKRMRITAYIKDAALEKAVFTALHAEVKGLPQIDKRIVYEKELAPVLNMALQRAGLEGVQAVYLPGRVDFVGDMAGKDVAALVTARQIAEQHIGVPLAGALDTSVRSIAATLLPAQPSKPAAAAARAAAAPAESATNGAMPLQGVRVTGVTMSPMRFVTAADGNRYFEGAVLPSGYTLRTIDTKQLVLQLGDSVVTHTLRGTE